MKRMFLLRPAVCFYLAAMVVAWVLPLSSRGGSASSETYLDVGSSPSRIAMDASRNFYVTDPWTGEISVLSPLGSPLTTIVPSETVMPLGIVILPGGEIAVSDVKRGAVDIYNSSWVYQRSLGVGTGEFLQPADIAVHSGTGNLYVVDTMANRVGIYGSAGNLVGTFGSAGSAPGQFSYPVAVAVRPGGNEVYVGDQANYRVQVFDLNGTYLRSIGSQGALPGQFVRIQGLAATGNGTLCVVDAFHCTVQVLDGQTGTFQAEFGEVAAQAGSGLLQPCGVVIDTQLNRLLVVSHNTGAVEVFDASGVLPPASVGDWVFLEN